MTLPVTRARCRWCHYHEQPVDPASRKRTFEVVHIGQWWCRHPEGRETREGLYVCGYMTRGGYLGVDEEYRERYGDARSAA